jgi:hypothetical protein
MFQKNHNKILKIANDEYYRRVKSQYELVIYILCYTKMTKSDKLYSVKICTIHYNICQIFHFCSLGI